MKLSVIIPCYNVENYLERAVSSVINQNFEDCQIIIVDDGSTDSSLQKALDLKNKFSFKISYIT